MARGYVPSQEEQVLAAVGAWPAARKSFPVGTDPLIAAEPYGPREDAGAWRFNLGWRFATPPGTDALAVGYGVVHFSPPSGGLPALLGLRLAGAELPALYVAGLPRWLPAPRWAIYVGLETATVHAAATALLDAGRLEGLQAAATSDGGGALTAAQAADAFVAGTLGGIPVEAGEPLGRGASAGSGREFELRFAQAWEMSGLVQNPAYPFHWWEDLGLLEPAGHPLADTLLRIDEGVQASGVLRFVSASAPGAAISGEFEDPAAPARTLGAALAACSEADTVVILDASAYREGELLIDKGVNVTSAAALPAGARHLGGGAEPGALGLPALEGGESYARIREDGSNDDDVKPSSRGRRAVRIELPEGAGIASLTKVVVRHGGAREGGGIYIKRESAAVIASCHVHRNIGYFNIVPPHGPFDGSGWFEEGSGGGIGIYKASPLIWGCRIERNLANYGGAIGIFAWCYPTIRDNLIRANSGPDWWPGVTITDGGAIRILQQSLRYETLEELRAAVAPGSALQPNPIPVDEMYDPITAQQAAAGWIHLIGNVIEDNHAADDGGGVYATALARLFSRGNRIQRNVAHRGDGGGIRLSTGSTLRSLSDVVADNRLAGPADASPTGAGIAARCSNLYLSGATVTGNDSPRFAGGGVAFTDTREGEVSAGIEWTARSEGYVIPSWDDQRRGGLQFDRDELQIDAGSLIAGNRAGDPERGKGAGLYVFRFAAPEFVADDLTVAIDAATGVLAADNVSGFEQPAGIRPYDRFYLLDQSKPGPADPDQPLRLGDADLAAGDFEHHSP